RRERDLVLARAAARDDRDLPASGRHGDGFAPPWPVGPDGPDGPATKWPTSIVTIEFSGAWVFGSGLWLTTLPSSAWLVVSTCITGTGGRPFETLTRTSVPLTTRVPGVGYCAVTVPGSRLDGTSTA